MKRIAKASTTSPINKEKIVVITRSITIGSLSSFTKICKKLSSFFFGKVLYPSLSNLFNVSLLLNPLISEFTFLKTSSIVNLYIISPFYSIQVYHIIYLNNNHHRENI